jgi:hypothetical protein
MSEVTICNLALAHLGDTAQVTSIKPPDRSTQAQLCARFYPVSRDALLEMATWGFATRRVALAEVTNPTINTWTDGGGNQHTSCGTWRFAYALPAGAVNVISVLPPDARSDYQESPGSVMWNDGHDFFGGAAGLGDRETETKQFAVETAEDGSQIVLTNVCSAILRYTVIVTDTTKFSPLFTLALSHLLASQLAGPIIKGDAGAAVSQAQLQLFGALKGQATASDANQRKTNVQPSPTWIRGR